MKIPFLDLAAQYRVLKHEIDPAIQDVIDKTAFAGGPFVTRFEEQFAPYCGTRHARGVGNGTDALWFALLAAGVGAGHEVITAPNSFFATAEAISICGATPVFVDVDEQTYTMDPARIEGAITSRTRAIVPVHLFGQPAAMGPILAIAKRHGLPVIEDACQAHGAEYNGRRAGSLGIAGCFSFYPGKNLGAYGEGGAVVTDDEGLARKISALRDHGQSDKHTHTVIGWNGRLDGIQAAVLSVKLKYLDAANEARRAHARQYNRLLAGVAGVRTPVEASEVKHVYHLYVIRVPNRDAVMQRLAERGVGCAIHYPTPIHLQDAYRSLGGNPGDFPVAETCAREILSLPMFPELTGLQIEYVAESVRAAMAAG